MIEVSSKLVLKDIKTTEDIINFLVELGSIDADFSGANGEEYLWDDARAKGYENNATYLANEVVFHSSVPSNKGMLAYAKEFAQQWLSRDTYYRSIEITVEKLDPDDISLEGIHAASIIATYDA